MDTAIKLFGKTIPLQPGDGCGDDEKSQDHHKEETSPISNDQGQETPDSPEKNESTTTTSEVHGPASTDQEDASTKNSTTTTEEQQPTEDASNSKDKAVKKPDKILPCPRCKSLDTKFCYYNNYNVNQPRHFCKNCQRYWTAGGTMRNVPVGAGRRKSKNSSHYRHITISESSFQALRSSAAAHEPVHYPCLKPNATVLSFGINGIEEKTKSCCNKNGDEHSNRSEEASSRGTTAPVPCFSGSPWPYPWTAAAAPYCSSSFAIPFYPAVGYWGCSVPPGAWSIPWLSPVAPSAPSGCHPGAGSNYSALGKHSREGDMLKHISAPKQDDDHKQQANQETCILVPKTLRIDDPEEAAKSSIWTMVGNKSSSSNNNNNARTSGGLLKAFRPKVDIKKHVLEAASLLHTNPAAMSRSLNFQETS